MLYFVMRQLRSICKSLEALRISHLANQLWSLWDGFLAIAIKSACGHVDSHKLSTTILILSIATRRHFSCTSPPKQVMGIEVRGAGV